MLQSVKGLTQWQDSDNIKQMNEKSNFSAQQDIDEKPTPDQSVKTKQGQNDKGQNMQLAKVIEHKIQSLENNVSATTNASQHKQQYLQTYTTEMSTFNNINNKTTTYTCLFYFITATYLSYLLIFLIPSMTKCWNISSILGIVLAIVLLVNFLFMMMSYQKARKTSPGYPLPIMGRCDRKNVQQSLEQPEMQAVKNLTIELLIEKEELTQAYNKNPSESNQQKLLAFQYKFFVQSIKFCQKCDNIKYPRVRHCSECNRCVERMDHHCFWLNNCVGRGNHKYFMLFLFFLIVGLTFFSIVGLVDLIRTDDRLSTYLYQQYGIAFKIVHFLLLLLAVILQLYYVFVFFEQLYLIANNLTFVESLSKVLSEKKPWRKQSIRQNFTQVFGKGCWVCPSSKSHTGESSAIETYKDKKKSSVQLVQQGIVSQKETNLTSFDSENNLKHDRNEI